LEIPSLFSILPAPADRLLAHFVHVLRRQAPLPTQAHRNRLDRSSLTRPICCYKGRWSEPRGSVNFHRNPLHRPGPAGAICLVADVENYQFVRCAEKGLVPRCVRCPLANVAPAGGHTREGIDRKVDPLFFFAIPTSRNALFSYPSQRGRWSLQEGRPWLAAFFHRRGAPRTFQGAAIPDRHRLKPSQGVVYRRPGQRFANVSRDTPSPPPADIGPALSKQIAVAWSVRAFVGK
jgi:hypothetical protein